MKILPAPDFTSVPTVLVITRDTVSASALVEVLSSAGYQVTRAATGQQAVEAALCDTPIAAYVEYPLPDVDGAEAEAALCLSLRLLVGVVTRVCAPQQEPRDFLLQRDCTSTLAKPLRPEAVIAALRHGLATHSPPADQVSLVKRFFRVSAGVHSSLAVTVHDLKSPLLSIRGLARLLSAQPSCEGDPAARDATNAILSASERGLQVVDKILGSSASAVPCALTTDRHDCVELVREVIQLLGGWAAAKSVTVRLLDPETELFFRFDRNRLFTAVENLIGNAIKFSPPGALVEVEICRNEGEVVIAVRDEGPGLSEEDQELLFQDFQRGAAEATGGESCTGLGLALSRRIVWAHGGSMTHRNLSPRGAEFVIEIPVEGVCHEP
jgi:signal transduction histidine kinase